MLSEIGWRANIPAPCVQPNRARLILNGDTKFETRVGYQKTCVKEAGFPLLKEGIHRLPINDRLFALSLRAVR
jgi:hypothetical protein